jgi:hypothetical protein
MSRLWLSALRVFFVVLLLLPSLAGQPRFDRDHVVPYGSGRAGTLTIGQFVSVLGWQLTPKNWCDAPHTAERPYPLTLCGVEVRIGGQRAGIMYAGAAGNRIMGADQINFQVPSDLDAEGETPIQVCVANTCSEAVNVPFTRKDILLRVQGKAYVHMPLWVEFTIPFNDNFSYPVSACPWNFGGFQIEVRQGGQLLPSSPAPRCPDADRVGGFSAMILPKGASHRLPAHLYHSFDTPGRYEVRMSGPLFSPDLSNESRTGYSDWIPVTVQPFSDAARQAWLAAMTSSAPSGNTPLHETELVVSLLAQPDEKALRALLNLVPSPPPPRTEPRSRTFRGALRMNWAEDCLARNALAAFPDSLLKKVVPPARLVNLRDRPGYCYWK